MFWSKAKKPPAVHDVINRAYALRAVIVHVMTCPPPDTLESLRRQWSAEDWKKFCRQSNVQTAQHREELQRREYAKHLTPTERRIFEKPAQELDLQEYANVSWRVEALQVLLWALQRIETLPSLSHAHEASLEILKPPTMEPYESAVSAYALRDRAEIEKARDMAEFWHWRSRTRELVDRGDELSPDTVKSTGFKSYGEIVRHAARAASENGDVEMINDDFAVHGKPYRSLNAHEWAEVRSFTMERHFALNWLCGYAPKNRWDDTQMVVLDRDGFVPILREKIDGSAH